VILFAVALAVWVLLTLPVAVLMGKCISRGLAPAGELVAVRVPQQRTAPAEAGRPRAQAGRSHA